MQRRDSGSGQGKLYIVGIGPGHPLDRTFRAVQAIKESQVLVGYTRYIELVADLVQDRQVVATGMTREKERCARALQEALSGRTVSLLSSGDAGIYGMAGLVLEMIQELGVEIDVETVPGVSASQAAAAALGAPLMLDFACLSLSDILVDWAEIEKRLEALAGADLVVVIYNPKSRKRTWQIQEAVRIFLKYRPGNTLAGLVRNASLPDQSICLTDLEHLADQEMDMRTVVIIGSSRSRMAGSRLVTSRGYDLFGDD